MTLAIDQSSVSLTRRGRGSHCLSEWSIQKMGRPCGPKEVHPRAHQLAQSPALCELAVRLAQVAAIASEPSCSGDPDRSAGTTCERTQAPMHCTPLPPDWSPQPQQRMDPSDEDERRPCCRAACVSFLHSASR
jgi:hypothetical protein